MKLLSVLTLLAGLAVAVEASHPRQKGQRPKKASGIYSFQALGKPKGAPAGYSTGLGKPSVKQAKTGLTKLPSQYIDPKARRRRDSHEMLRLLRRQSTAQDFYECRNVRPAPADADCNEIINQVYNSGTDPVVISANACLTFTYQTCEGFFCSLCQDLETDPSFIGNQLNTAEALCVGNGQAGTIVGQDAPQWDAGFVRTGASLPTYDVC